jgi:hypothetical protein
VAAADGTAHHSYFGQYRGGLSCGDGPLAHRAIRFLTLEELARLFAVARASPRDRALFLIAYRHGLRASCCVPTTSISGRCASWCIG